MNKNVLKLILFPILSTSLFACGGSPVNEHPTPKTSESEKSSEVESPIESSTESEEVTPKEYKVLFIGNSFTFYNELDVVSEAIGKNLGLNITCERVAASSYHLYQHADSSDDYGKQIEEKIQKNTYTHIIMQEHSTYPVNNYNGFLSGATQLYNKLKQYQPNASISLYQTWGFQNMVGSYGSDIPACEQSLCEAYQKCAKALDIKVHYVGKAFTKVYKENSNINLYYSDNKHPSYSGTYLAALVHLMSITNVDVRDVTYQGIEGKTTNVGEVSYIDDDKADILRNAAYNIVKTYGTNY